MKYKIGIMIFPQVEELDFVGPYEMITMWKKIVDEDEKEEKNKQKDRDVTMKDNSSIISPECCLIISENGGPIRCSKGLSINSDMSFDQCGPSNLDILLIPGGQGTRTEVNNEILVDFIRKQSFTCKHILSVCTGSFLLHAAGLLKGKQGTTTTTTTYYSSIDRLRELIEHDKESGVLDGVVEVVDNKRYTHNGNIWCSAGVSAGIDMTLAFIAHVAGNDIAGKVQLQTEYYPSEIIYGHNKILPGYVEVGTQQQQEQKHGP